MSDNPTTPAEAPAAPPPDFLPTKVVNDWEYTSPLIGCRFDPSGRFIVTAAHDANLQRWDSSSGEKVVLAGHESWARSLAFSKDSQTLYSAGYDGRLIWWPLADPNPQPVRQVEAHAGWIRGLDLSPDGSQLVTVGNDHLVKIWNAADGQLLQTLTGHQGHVYSVLWPHVPNTILSGDLLGVVHQWDLAAGRSVRTFDAAELHSPNEGQGARYGGVRSMSLRPDGKQLACGGLFKASNPFGAVQEPLVLIFDWETGKKQAQHLAEGIAQGIVWRVVHDPSGILCGCSGGGSGGFLFCWREGQEKEIHKLQLPSTALDMDFHPQSKRFVTAHHDKHLRVSGV